MGTRRLRCLVTRHQWHNGWDDGDHVTVWTCKRCGALREEPVQHPQEPGAWSGGGGATGGGGF